MHQLITNLKIVDHIDQDKTNNRKSNFRQADMSKNSMNRNPPSSNKSGVRGVSYYGSKSCWVGEILKNGKKYRNSFSLFDEAVKFRTQQEAILFADFSPLHNKQTDTLQLTYLSHDDNKQTFIESDMNGNIISFEKLS